MVFNSFRGQENPENNQICVFPDYNVRVIFWAQNDQDSPQNGSECHFMHIWVNFCENTTKVEGCPIFQISSKFQIWKVWNSENEFRKSDYCPF